MLSSYQRRHRAHLITGICSLLIVIMLCFIAWQYRFELFPGYYQRQMEKLAKEAKIQAASTSIAPKQTAKTGASDTSSSANTTQPNQAVADSEVLAKSANGAIVMPKLEGDETEKMIEDYFGKLPEITATKKPEHVKTHAIYCYNPFNMDYYLNLVKGSSVNALVIDIKTEWSVAFNTNVKLAQDIGAIINPYDLEAVVKRCHDAGLRVIGRLVCFNDSVLTEKRPDLCISDKKGNPLHFPLDGDKSFASPYKKEVWQYLIDIGKDAVSRGVDEIQFDYVRFPSGSPSENEEPYFGEPDATPERYQALNRFLQTATIEINHNLGVPLGMDLFSIVMTSAEDGKAIGQNWDIIGMNGQDNICPMIYPSHYANSSSHYTGNGIGSYIGDGFFEKPDLHPYEVIEGAIVDGDRNIDRNEFAHIRPYLQAFTAEYLPDGYYMHYGTEEIKEQIRALEEQGIDEWILWNAGDTYPPLNF